MIFDADLTQANVRLQLAELDAHELQTSMTMPVSDISRSTLVSMGLELEESL